jgi:hypothetical protein
MAAFFPFLAGDRQTIPAKSPGDYRLASFVGETGGDQLIPGPVMDTTALDDLRMVLMLVGVDFAAMQVIRRNDGEAVRFAWIAFDAILAINPDLTFALGEPAARDFLLDLREAAEMMAMLRPAGLNGCMIEIMAAEA